MKVSVIIPVYKVEQYLDECLQSVFSQTYKDLEIILVDDGSPDKCPQLCDEYARQDNRIKVIHKENGGLSDARNAGIKIATGEYVLFLDSDDYWSDKNLIKTLIDEVKVESRVDVVIFRRKEFYEKSSKQVESPLFDIKNINGRNKNDVFRQLLLSQQLSMAAWIKLVRRQLFIENDLFFIKGQLSEDIDWTLRLFMVAGQIRVNNIIGYAYRHRTSSITTTYGIRNQSDFASVLSKWIHIAENEMQDKELAQLYLGYLAFLYPTLLRNYYLVQKKDRKEEYNLLKPLNYLLKYSMTPKSGQVKKINSILGFRLTCMVVGLFGLIRKRGWRALIMINK
ncbi:MAG: glycosyltransferase family 2 protein [Prevotellaceae bacterium]|jgi:glycosyltransferase involved in cell wall biosynthesis|nr:glycosyltransferase family 2 protein [Prevotellaceae bacterium]